MFRLASDDISSRSVFRRRGDFARRTHRNRRRLCFSSTSGPDCVGPVTSAAAGETFADDARRRRSRYSSQQTGRRAQPLLHLCIISFQVLTPIRDDVYSQLLCCRIILCVYRVTVREGSVRPVSTTTGRVRMTIPFFIRSTT